jgi:hypothetical protein
MGKIFIFGRKDKLYSKLSPWARSKLRDETEAFQCFSEP